MPHIRSKYIRLSCRTKAMYAASFTNKTSAHAICDLAATTLWSEFKQ